MSCLQAAGCPALKLMHPALLPIAKEGFQQMQAQVREIGE